MFLLIFWTIVLSAASGLIAKFVLDRLDLPEEITWKEFAISMAAIAFLVAPGVTTIGWSLARSSLVGYNEYWNGWETKAVKQDIICERDGACAHDYNCDPYECNPHNCNCMCISRDKNGSCTSESCSTCYDTCYHHCPYSTTEHNFIVDTTLGDFTISAHRFPENPQSHRWDKSERIPDGVIANAGVGAPAFWSAAKARIEGGDPGPVCVRRSYENYILASDQTILKQYSSEIARFSSLGLLPKLNSGIHDFYWAEKVYFVGYKPNDIGAWQWAVSRFDSALGAEMQGDLHLVIVQNAAVSQNPDSYALALQAYWQNTKVFGPDALSKNGIGVIVGTDDGQTVAWTRAFTGMPVGNEELTIALRGNLKHIAMTPEAVVGTLRGQIYTEGGKIKVRGLHGQGVLERAVWGIADPHTKFKRYSMSGKSGAGAGFLYLRGEIEPTSEQKFWIFFCTFFASGAAWVASAFIGERTYKRNRR